MKRQTFRAILTDADGRTLDCATAYAWNSAIRAGEALVRSHARDLGRMHIGDAPSVLDIEGDTAKPGAPGAVYQRVWRPVGSADDALRVIVTMSRA